MKERKAGLLTKSRGATGRFVPRTHPEKKQKTRLDDTSQCRKNRDTTKHSLRCWSPMRSERTTETIRWSQVFSRLGGDSGVDFFFAKPPGGPAFFELGRRQGRRWRGRALVPETTLLTDLAALPVAEDLAPGDVAALRDFAVAEAEVAIILDDLPAEVAGRDAAGRALQSIAAAFLEELGVARRRGAAPDDALGPRRRRSRLRLLLLLCLLLPSIGGGRRRRGFALFVSKVVVVVGFCGFCGFAAVDEVVGESGLADDAGARPAVRVAARKDACLRVVGVELDDGGEVAEGAALEVR
mmetsp:Transcript_28985/g.93455  ORF Transcript_28985/g.93455 Transcript_28985/m.93455 type:complete len:297 (+) Transcript_28985:308-1198(+)